MNDKPMGFALNEEKLLPCPFCGKQPEIAKVSQFSNISCRTDGCINPMTGSWPKFSEAVACWNTRPKDTRLAILLNECHHSQQVAFDALEERDKAREQLATAREALKEIASIECGIPGHSVAIGCGCPGVARPALSSIKSTPAPTGIPLTL